MFPAGVLIGGVTPGSTAVCIRISAEVWLQVCQRAALWLIATEETFRYLPNKNFFPPQMLTNELLWPVREVCLPFLTQLPSFCFGLCSSVICSYSINTLQEVNYIRRQTSVDIGVFQQGQMVYFSLSWTKVKQHAISCQPCGELWDKGNFKSTLFFI